MMYWLIISLCANGSGNLGLLYYWYINMKTLEFLSWKMLKKLQVMQGDNPNL